MTLDKKNQKNWFLTKYTHSQHCRV